MNKEQLQEKINNLKIQKEKVQNSYLKILGAIEILENILEEENSKGNGVVKKAKEKVTS